MSQRQCDIYDFMQGGTLAKARSADPAESKEAAERMNRSGKSSTLSQAVFECLDLAGGGMTSTEIALKLGVGRDSVSPRMRGLQESGLVRRSGERRNGQAVWVRGSAK